METLKFGAFVVCFMVGWLGLDVYKRYSQKSDLTIGCGLVYSYHLGREQAYLSVVQNDDGTLDKRIMGFLEKVKPDEEKKKCMENQK